MLHLVRLGLMISEKLYHRHRSVLFNGAVNCYDFIASVVGEQNISKEHWWNDVSRKTKSLEKKLPQPRLVHHRSHVDWPVIDPGTFRGERHTIIRHGHGAVCL